MKDIWTKIGLMFRTTVNVAAVDCGYTKIYCEAAEIRSLPHIILHQGDPSVENLSIGAPMLFLRIRDKINLYISKFFKWMADSKSLDILREQAAKSDKLLAVYVTESNKFISEGVQKIVLSVEGTYLGNLQKDHVQVHCIQFSYVPARMESLQVPISLALQPLRSVERDPCCWSCSMPC